MEKKELRGMPEGVVSGSEGFQRGRGHQYLLSSFRGQKQDQRARDTRAQAKSQKEREDQPATIMPLLSDTDFDLPSV